MSYIAPVAALVGLIVAFVLASWIDVYKRQHLHGRASAVILREAM